MNKKQLGVLLHLSSLPGDYGIGDLGYEAYQFADFLVDQGYRYWQILPLYHTGYGNSPYNPLSAFALNPYLISPDLLFEDGLIDQPDLEAAKLPISNQISYDAVFRSKDKLNRVAADKYLANNDITDYIESNALYLKPYLAYLTLARLYGDSDWQLYRPEHHRYSEALYDQLFSEYGRSMQQVAATQIIIADQLQRFKRHLSSAGITLIGDMPLYLSYNSAEVWANRELFLLDENGHRLEVAGVPPDAFAREGQLWGNPLYRWDRMKEDGFALFQARIAHALSYLDLLRLDHFIGYINYWSVPCERDPGTGIPVLPPNAMGGSWLPAEGEALFSLLAQSFGTSPFIAEDLGILNHEVCRIRDGFGFPGMIILQFCFEDSVPDVAAYPPDRFLYTGTHDNPTLREWWTELAPDSPSRINIQAFIMERPHIFKALSLFEMEPEKHIHRVMAEIALASGCGRIIFPLQDLLGYGSEARMNVPGTALGNWQWRLDGFSALEPLRQERFPAAFLAK